MKGSPPPSEQTPRQRMRALLISVRSKIRDTEREMKDLRTIERALTKARR